MAAAFVLFRRPPSLWTRQTAALAGAARQKETPPSSLTGGLAADGSAAGGAPVTRSTRGQVAQSLALSGEVDETNDAEETVDPEQARPLCPAHLPRAFRFRDLMRLLTRRCLILWPWSWIGSHRRHGTVTKSPVMPGYCAGGVAEREPQTRHQRSGSGLGMAGAAQSRRLHKRPRVPCWLVPVAEHCSLLACACVPQHHLSICG